MMDLSVAADGYAGIPHDARLIFSMLSDHNNLGLSGLIYPLAQTAPFRLRPKSYAYTGQIAAALHIASHADHRPSARHPLLRITNLAREMLREGLGVCKGGRSPCKIPDWQKRDVLWRMLFQKTLPEEDRDRVLAKDFYFANVSVNQIHGRANYLPFLRPHHLDIADCDAVIFPCLRPFRVPASTAKIVRYHDAVSLIHPDTVAHWPMSVWEQRFTNLCAKDSIFACNSPSSRDDLDKVAPGAGEHAVVLPTAVPVPPPVHSPPTVLDIVARRRSSLVLTVDEMPSHQTINLQRMIDAGIRSTDKLRYIISVSTIEPRKNFTGLIAAWERLRAATRQDIKLLLVANKGWGMDPTLDAMRPHVLAGNLIHLHNVGPSELQVLYEGAELCAFIPFAEGFGNCPLEALRSGTPVVASDIPVFRWTLRDAGTFVSPYSAGRAADAMQSLIDEPQNRDRRAEIRQRAPLVLEQFSTTAISQQWKDFLWEGLPKLLEKLRAPRPRYYRYAPQAADATLTHTGRA